MSKRRTCSACGKSVVAIDSFTLAPPVTAGYGPFTPSDFCNLQCLRVWLDQESPPVATPCLDTTPEQRYR